jgi:hypothetical protein
VVFTTGAGRPVWETLLPISADVTGMRRCPAPQLRAVLNADVPGLQQALAQGRDELLRQLRQSTRPAFRRWSRRERDLMAALRARHARLSAGLLQRGLFDRRDERMAAAQTATLDAALSQSESRLRELMHSGDIRVDSNELLFAVLLE